MKKRGAQINARYGKLIVKEKTRASRSGHLYFRCQCDCGQETEVLGTHLIQGNTTSCGCNRASGKEHYKWSGCGDLTGNHWNQIVRNATGKKNRELVSIEITIEDAWNLFVAQGYRCALTNLPITLGSMKTKTASLDRIDSSRGYVKGNIQWVHKDINKMKNTFSQEYFIKMCKLVAKEQ